MTGRIRFARRAAFGAAVPLVAVVLAPSLRAPAAPPHPPAAVHLQRAGGVEMVIHGGAGTIRRGDMSPELERAYREALGRALRAGHDVLAAGGTALDAVEAAIRVMEDSPLFNAGRGAVFTARGRNEMDASIMNGADLKAGAVAAVTGIKNPIRAARRVMEATRHVMLVGDGAVAFAREQGLELADSAYFFTERRWKSLMRAREAEREHGTVGAVALDRHGNLAAGTSTGGLTNKRWGRVGDSPIIGAGTYANNATCGVSGTGVGEFFMRGLVAYDVSAHMAYLGLPLHEAARRVIDKLGRMGGDGGFIALDARGEAVMTFNTEGMYRGTIGPDGVPHVYLYRE